MKIGKILMAGALVAVISSSAAMAMDDGKGGNFAEHKAKILERMQKKIDCVKAANDKEAMKTCFPHWKEHEGMMKNHMKGDHKAPDADDGAPE